MSLASSLCQYVLLPRRGMGQASLNLEAPRLQALETRDLFHQHGMTKTSRYTGLVLGSFLAPEIDMIFADGVGASFYGLIIYSLPVLFVFNALFFFLMLSFHMYNPNINFVHVCTQLISLRNEHLLGDTFDVLCLVCTNSRQNLKTSLCRAFYWRKPCQASQIPLR